MLNRKLIQRARERLDNRQITIVAGEIKKVVLSIAYALLMS